MKTKFLTPRPLCSCRHLGKMAPKIGFSQMCSAMHGRKKIQHKLCRAENVQHILNLTMFFNKKQGHVAFPILVTA